MSTDELPECPSCAAPINSGDLFCESCGAPLSDRDATGDVTTDDPKTAGDPTNSEPTTAGATATLAPCTACAGSVAPDGYCESCGKKQPSPRDHLEVDFGLCGATVTDRGLRHHRNEDAVGLSLEPNGYRVVCVCDGVSSAPRSDDASQAAVDAAILTTVTELAAGTDIELAMRLATKAAHAAVSKLAEGEANIPSCTYCLAVATETEIFVAWIGDSRAYWIGPNQTTQLTVDDSWAAAAVESGEKTLDEAMLDPRAHQITGWLGADFPEFEPHLVRAPYSPEGLLLLCSDGLWNEVPSAQDLHDLVHLRPGRSPLMIARELCDYANACGGPDNISIAVVPLNSSTTGVPSE